jgi:Asp-tRNA(Asn)/Glu-tRNA(Gln) amidotransferase C subunit
MINTFIPQRKIISMSKIMPLDLLSSIKGARSSEAVKELFKVINQAIPASEAEVSDERNVEAVGLEDLRDDHIERSPEIERELIKKNFPKAKDGYLVVPKVIED